MRSILVQPVSRLGNSLLRALPIIVLALISAFGLSITKADAAASITFTSPADGSSAPVGTMVMPEGNANATGSTGTGLDLVLVLDSSGSMGTSIGGGNTRRDAQAAAAIALVNGLPTAGTSVSVVEFDSDSNTVRTLLPLTGAGNLASIIAAINGVNASGGTSISAGIVEGTAELDARSTAGRSHQMVVVSDGFSSQAAATAAAAAAAVKGYTVNTVAIPGASTSVLQAVATAGGGTFTDASTASGLNDLVSLFDGTAGNLVGVDTVDITMPDGTVLTDIGTDGLGNFKVPVGYNLLLGPNTWNAKVTATNGDMATASVTVYGTAGGGGTPVVPLPASIPLLLSGLAFFGFAGSRRRR